MDEVNSPMVATIEDELRSNLKPRMVRVNPNSGNLIPAPPPPLVVLTFIATSCASLWGLTSPAFMCVLAVFIAALMFLCRQFIFDYTIVAYGRPTIATVIQKDMEQRDPNKSQVVYVIHYRFEVLPSNGRHIVNCHKVVNAKQYDRLEQGDAVTVVYAPVEPGIMNCLYPFSSYLAL